MCLSSKVRKLPKAKYLTRAGVGWKYLRISGEVASTGFVSHQLPVNTWVKDPNTSDYAIGLPYPSGFHIYKEKPPYVPHYMHPLAKLHKVLYRHVIVEGRQDRRPCVVAREIFIPVGRPKKRITK